MYQDVLYDEIRKVHESKDFIKMCILFIETPKGRNILKTVSTDVDANNPAACLESLNQGLNLLQPKCWV